MNDAVGSTRIKDLLAGVLDATDLVSIAYAKVGNALESMESSPENMADIHAMQTRIKLALESLCMNYNQIQDSLKKKNLEPRSNLSFRRKIWLFRSEN